MPKFGEHENENPQEYDRDGFSVVDDPRMQQYIPGQDPLQENQELELEEEEIDLDKIDFSEPLKYPVYNTQLSVTDGTQDTLPEFDEHSINNFDFHFDETPAAGVNYKHYNEDHHFFGAKTPERRTREVAAALQNAAQTLSVGNESIDADQFFYDLDKDNPGKAIGKQISALVDSYSFLTTLLDCGYADLSTTRLLQINNTLNTLLGKTPGGESLSALLRRFNHATDFEYTDRPEVKTMTAMVSKLEQVKAILERSATADYYRNILDKAQALDELQKAITVQNKDVDELSTRLINAGISSELDKNHLENARDLANEDLQAAKKELNKNELAFYDAKKFFDSQEYKTWALQAPKVQQYQKDIIDRQKILSDAEKLLPQAVSESEQQAYLLSDAEKNTLRAKEKLEKTTKAARDAEAELYETISPQGRRIYEAYTRDVKQAEENTLAIRNMPQPDDHLIAALINPDARKILSENSADPGSAFGKACSEFVAVYNKQHPRGFFSKEPSGDTVLKNVLEEYKKTKDLRKLQNELTKPFSVLHTAAAEQKAQISMEDSGIFMKYRALCVKNEKKINIDASEYQKIAAVEKQLREKSTAAAKRTQDIEFAQYQAKNDIKERQEQIRKIQGTWDKNFPDMVKKNRKIIQTYPEIIANNKYQANKANLMKENLEKSLELFEKIQKNGESAHQKYEKYMSVKHITEFTDTKYEEIHQSLQDFYGRINDKRGNHKNTDEYNAMTTALYNAFNADRKQLADKLDILAKMAQEYIDKKNDQTFVIGSKLRHTRLNYAEELKIFARANANLMREAQPFQLTKEQLTGMQLQESFRPNIKSLNDVKIPTKEQILAVQQRLEKEIKEPSLEKAKKEVKDYSQIPVYEQPVLNI